MLGLSPHPMIPLHSRPACPQLSSFLHGPWLVSAVSHVPLCSLCRSITVVLGAHDIKKPERTQQVISVKRAICHPDYQPKVNDIMLLQVGLIVPPVLVHLNPSMSPVLVPGL